MTTAATAATAAERSDAVPASEEPLPAARPVTAVPTAVPVAVVLCLALVALGGVAVREALVGLALPVLGRVPGQPWLAPVLESATSVVPGVPALAAGVGVAVLGAVTLVAALARRRRRTLTLDTGAPGASAPLQLRPRSAAALAADTALGVDGVVASRVTGGRRRLVVQATVDPAAARSRATVAEELARSVRARLAGVSPAPRVAVRTRELSR